MRRGDVGAEQVGLTQNQASALLRRVGRNVLPAVRGVPMWRQLLGQFVHFFALMLWAAAALALVGGLPQLAVAIVAVVVINGLFAFVQEYRAERAASRLQQLLPVRACVVRDGLPQVIDADQIVPGDLVILREGDRIAA
ncbi:MAG: cation-transporting P-type ATPase, partial [Candidatus Nanopelagicales bacterium]|nr:cation-transporting P-type ATPase [Candidatus Nanopelagicales bacterium]